MAPVSLDPRDATKGGLPLDGAVATVTRAEFIHFHYPPKAGSPPAQAIGLRIDLVDEEGTAYDEEAGGGNSYRFYSAGGVEEWELGEGGKTLEPLKRQPGLKENCNALLFVTHLENAGVPEGYLSDGDISKLVGLKAEWAYTSIPRNIRGQASEGNILVATRVLQLPSERGARASTRAAAPARAARGVPRGAAAAAPAATAVAEAEAEAPSANGASGGGENDAAIYEYVSAAVAAGDTNLKTLEEGVFTYARESNLPVRMLRSALTEEKLNALGFSVDEDGGVS